MSVDIMGAIRFVDATTSEQVGGRLSVQAALVDVRPNRSGLYVIWRAPGGASTLTVSDPEGRYVSRRFRMQFPRDANLANAGEPSSIYQPEQVRLFPSPIAATSPGWALLRATVKKAGSAQVLAGALIRIVRASDSKLLASGVSDARGEALVIVPGIPVTLFDGGTGPVVGTALDVNVQTVFDPAAQDAPDPDDIESHKDTLPSSTVSRKLSSGQTLVAELMVTVP